MKKVVVGICTYNRNDLLNLCLDRIYSVQLPKDVHLDVIVVDNSAEAAAKDLVEQKARVLVNGGGGDPLKLHYFSFHGKGIASVRNEVLRRAKVLQPDYIAFIDDDEFPSENWLVKLYSRIENSDADVVTGPVVYNFIDVNLNPLNVPDWIKNNSYFKGKYKRPDGHICMTASTNNVLFKTALLDKMEYWFDERYQMMTGEDIDFFERIHRLGYKILWVKDAIVNEVVSPNRCNFKYIWKRNFNNGYLRIFNKKKNDRLQVKHYFGTILNALIFLLLFAFSIFGGLTTFSNCYGKLAFSMGAFVSLFKSKAFVFYKD